MGMHTAANWNQNAGVKWFGLPDFGCTVLALQHVDASNRFSRSLSLSLVFRNHVTPPPSTFRGWGCNGLSSLGSVPEYTEVARMISAGLGVTSNVRDNGLDELQTEDHPGDTIDNMRSDDLEEDTCENLLVGDLFVPPPPGSTTPTQHCDSSRSSTAARPPRS